MQKQLIGATILFLLFSISAFSSFIVLQSGSVLGTDSISGAPPGGIPESDIPKNLTLRDVLANWNRPEGPPKIGIQVGHWKNDEVPEELKNLRNNTGAYGGGKWEWEVNYEIALAMKEILEKDDITVDILPTTVPPSYWADIFIAIHADGSESRSKSGYKFSGPWRDFTRRSDQLVELLEQSYEKYTDLEKDPNITKNMRGYYAFAWWRYKHAIHPMTTAVIAETGFLTNPEDQKLLIQTPEIPALAMSEAIIEYLRFYELL